MEQVSFSAGESWWLIRGKGMQPGRGQIIANIVGLNDMNVSRKSSSYNNTSNDKWVNIDVLPNNYLNYVKFNPEIM